MPPVRLLGSRVHSDALIQHQNILCPDFRAVCCTWQPMSVMSQVQAPIVCVPVHPAGCLTSPTCTCTCTCSSPSCTPLPSPFSWRRPLLPAPRPLRSTHRMNWTPCSSLLSWLASTRRALPVLAVLARLLDIPIIRTAEPNVPWNVFLLFCASPSLHHPHPRAPCATNTHTHSYAAEAERTRRFAVFQGNLRKCERMNVDEGEEVFGVTKFSVSKFQSYAGRLALSLAHTPRWCLAPHTFGVPRSPILSARLLAASPATLPIASSPTRLSAHLSCCGSH